MAQDAFAGEQDEIPTRTEDGQLENLTALLIDETAIDFFANEGAPRDGDAD